jgi:hypothetical protein
MFIVNIVGVIVVLAIVFAVLFALGVVHDYYQQRDKCNNLTRLLDSYIWLVAPSRAVTMSEVAAIRAASLNASICASDAWRWLSGWSRVIPFDCELDRSAWRLSYKATEIYELCRKAELRIQQSARS